MKAVILAAGMGMRLREHHQLPKGFLVLDQEPIIVQSINKLRAYGIQDILIVTGYKSEYYDELAARDKNITTVRNEIYDQSGSLYSLYCVREWIKDDFLLLESDLIYEERAIARIKAAPAENVILISGATHSNDEIYVEAFNDLLINMSKNRNILVDKRIIGEFVGINKLSLMAYKQLIRIMEDNPNLLRTGHYEEQGLVQLSQYKKIYCLLIKDLMWSEIDNLEHLNRARQLYSQLRSTII